MAPIVANSLRFCSSGNRIEASCISETVVIEISNDGPASQRRPRRNFGPGLPEATDEEHDGAGLGLPLARRLARASDGDVSLARFDPVPSGSNSTG